MKRVIFLIILLCSLNTRAQTDYRVRGDTTIWCCNLTNATIVTYNTKVVNGLMEKYKGHLIKYSVKMKKDRWGYYYVYSLTFAGVDLGEFTRNVQQLYNQ